jgi:phospholipase C
VPPDEVLGRCLLDSAFVRRFLSHTSFFSALERADSGPRAYDRYGFRVPAVVVSPYARPNWVCSADGDGFFDHTSVLRLIEERWGLPAMTRRDLAARAPERGSILDALDLTNPAFAFPPDLALPRLLEPSRARD